jgi:hypothetical protein
MSEYSNPAQGARPRWSVRFHNSVELAKASWGVLREDKELAAIPLLSAVTCVVVALLFGGGAYLTLDHVTNPAPGQNDLNATPVTYVVGVIGLFAFGMVAQFFTGALVAGANERLEGGNPSLGRAFSKATTRCGPILGWAILNSTVGLLLQMLRERAGFLGAIVAGFIGGAWNVITWLALPIIIVEGIGPIAAVKRSAHLLRQTWGENIIAQGGLAVIGLLAFLPGLVVFGLVSVALPLLGIPLLFVYLVVIGSVMAALGAIFRTALYRFAAGLPTGEVFDQQALEGAFRVKKGKVGGTFN